MALEILKTPSSLPNLKDHYQRYISVECKRNTGLRKFLNLGTGVVDVAFPDGPAHPVFRITVPEWKGGQRDEWEILQQSYKRILQMAEFYHCSAIIIPLLTSDIPNFPAYIDYKIAVDTIQSFLAEHSMDVFLVARRPAAFQMPELRADVEQFLSRNLFREEPHRYSQIFADSSHFPSMPSCAGEQPYNARQCPPSAPDRRPLPPCAPTSAKPRRAIRIPTPDAGFSETLLKLIDKTGKKDSEIYNKANVSRQHFSKIRNNPEYKPTKATAIAFAIALELDMNATLDLIGRAGYTLTRSSKFDLIIIYFIEHHNYNMFDINETLYEFDQSLLGS